MSKGDFVEVLVDAGGGSSREYVIEATRAGRSIEVRSSRTTVEVRELTRTGGEVRTARFIAPRVLAVVDHPKDEQKAARGDPSPHPGGRLAAQAPGGDVQLRSRQEMEP